MLADLYIHYMMVLQRLQAFAKRPTIRRFAESVRVSFYAAWLAEVAVVKQAFEAARKQPPASPVFPATVAQAHEILQLRRRLELLLKEHKVHLSRLSRQLDG